MTHDDELRSRMKNLGDGFEVHDLPVEQVVARGRRRGFNQRLLAVAAVFVLFLGVAGVVRTIGNDDGELDVAVDGPVPTDSNDTESDPAQSPDEAVPPPATSSPLSADEGSDSLFAESANYESSGFNWVLPWGDGFVAIAQIFHPSEATVADFLQQMGDRLPTELVAAIEAADIGDAPGERFFEVLESDNLFELLDQSVYSDPQLSREFEALVQGTFTFEAQTSPDGVSWTDLDGFQLPVENLNYVRSDGTHILLTDQTWGPGDGGVSNASVLFTTDLVNWTTVDIPLDTPIDVPEFATVETSLGSVAVGPDGWYATTSTFQWVDLWSLLPSDVRDELEQNGWGFTPSPEGLRIESYNYGEEFAYPVTSLGVDDAIDDEFGYPVVGPVRDDAIEYEEAFGSTLERLVPWSEIGLGYAQYEDYLNGTGTSSAWTGRWDGSIAPATTPASANCCSVVGTDAGFLAWAWGEEFYEGEVAATGPDGTLYFSVDAQSWSAVPGTPGAGQLDGLTAVQGGVLITTSGPIGNSGEYGQQVWRANADGSDWQSVEIAGLPATQWLWFGESNSSGAAASVDVAVYDYEYVAPPPLVGLDVTFEVGAYLVHVTVGQSGFAHAVITDPATGELVFEGDSEWEATEADSIAEFLLITAESIDGGDGETPAFDFENVYDSLLTAERQIRETQDYQEPVYPEPDMWLVASIDGLTWHVEDIVDNPGGFYYGSQPAINDTTVVVRVGDDWLTFDLG